MLANIMEIYVMHRNKKFSNSLNLIGKIKTILYVWNEERDKNSRSKIQSTKIHYFIEF